MKTVSLNAAATKLARRGHPWFFADDLQEVAAQGGDLVRALDDAGRDLGAAFYSDASRIRLRLAGPFGSKEDELDPDAFFAARLAAAAQRRHHLADETTAVRLVHGDADGLPGLVADQYADCVVVQVTSLTVERHLSAVVPWLVEHGGARMVLARNDLAVRRYEGLPEEVALLHGPRVEEVEISEHGVRHRVRLFSGQKTGFYLDQRRARRRVKELARGRSVLDLFCYQGGFSLAALAGGARSALAIDQSAEALELAQSGAAANGFATFEVRHHNAFAALRDLRREGRQFDLVVVDPPPFARSKAERAGALRGYRDLAGQALRVLAPGGLLLMCSCSHHVTLPMFEQVLRQAAAGLPFKVLLSERIMAGSDHPVWISLPETEYLKVCLLQRVA